ncbi:MAG TPA: hypothetical protein VK509_24350, partial [Polyangiales bacterium]|nr:hypothetical protein [Polyangiales bacterium]
MRSATWVQWAGVIAALAAASLAMGCGDDDAVAPGDADGGDDAGPGGAGKDGGGFIRDRGENEFGDKCESSSDCEAGLVCDREIEVSYQVSGLPSRERGIIAPRFPDGVCSPLAAGAFDPNGINSCIPGGPTEEQGCGDDGACVPVTVADEQVVACRPSCDPSAKAPCGGRFGYTCDFEGRVCVEGCQSDEECRLQLIDADNNGAADALAYDEESEASCDTQSYRCVHDGAEGGAIGDPCARLDDCDPEGVCLDALQTFANTDFPGGYCTKLGCDQPGRECGRGAVCERLRPLRSSIVTDRVCLQSCEVGEEPEADRVGSDGHGAGCREGYACHYNGGTGSGGVCIGGNYNDVTENNIGAACESDSECYSPYGLGSCLVLAVGNPAVEAPTGVCTLVDCATPGLPEDLCGAGNECIGLDGDITFCVRTCTKADGCPDGFACADDDATQDMANPVTPNICFPACFTDADCRVGSEICRPV